MNEGFAHKIKGAKTSFNQDQTGVALTQGSKARIPSEKQTETNLYRVVHLHVVHCCNPLMGMTDSISLISVNGEVIYYKTDTNTHFICYGIQSKIGILLSPHLKPEMILLNNLCLHSC